MVTLLDHNAHRRKSADKFGPQPKIAVPPLYLNSPRPDCQHCLSKRECDSKLILVIAHCTNSGLCQP